LRCRNPLKGNYIRKYAVEDELGLSGTTIYVSFLLRQDEIGDFLHNDHDFGGLNLGGNNPPGMLGVGGLYIGRGAYGSRSDKYVLGTAGNAMAEASSGVPLVIGQSAFLVTRIDFLDGLDKATLYVNPVPGAPEPAGGTVYTGLDLGQFTQIAITNGNNSAWTTDEIRVATTWQEVTPTAEPSTLALLGIGGLVLGGCVWRRILQRVTGAELSKQEMP
jgi:hypothetical protein